MEKDKAFIMAEVLNRTATRQPTWNHCGFVTEMQSNELNYATEQVGNCFLNPNWDNSMDQSDPFESALSSMVSSPAASSVLPVSGENVMMRELIGKLGNICNSGDISPQFSSKPNTKNGSADASFNCTPLNSPPKLNLSMVNLQNHSNLTPFSADPGFAERAARFSCFRGLNDPLMDSFKLSGNQSVKVNGSQSLKNSPMEANSPEIRNPVFPRKNLQFLNRSQLETMPVPGKGNRFPGEKQRRPHLQWLLMPRLHRRAANRTRNEASKMDPLGMGMQKQKMMGMRSKLRRIRSHRSRRRTISMSGQEGVKQLTVIVLLKDSYHIENFQVRREKISERMKFLQDLVPGCNKVTGKAVMLDEIINYVQSLQHQVEFLSMKLATVNLRTNINMGALVSKDMFQSRGSLLHGIYSMDSSVPTFPFGYHPQQGLHLNNAIPDTTTESQFPMKTQGFQLPPIDGFTDANPHVGSIWEDDLQSIVQMGFGQNQPQSYQGSVATGQVKIES